MGIVSAGEKKASIHFSVFFLPSDFVVEFPYRIISALQDLVLT